MTCLLISPSELSGRIAIPPSKSHTLRAILFAALATGESTIYHYLPSPDTATMIEAVRLLGAEVKVEYPILTIRGFAGKPQIPKNVIDCGNSGIVLRFIGALAGLIPGYTILTGDDSIRTRRPVQPLLHGLNQLGAFAVSSSETGYAPLIIRGPLTKGVATVDGRDSQPVSGLLIAAAFAPHPTQLHVINPGEIPWIAMTLHWLDTMGIDYHAENNTYYTLKGSSQIAGFTYTVPGDLSSAAFPIAAALVTNSELTLHHCNLNDAQGDKAIIPLLEQMGAQFEIDPHAQTVTIKQNSRMTGARIDIDPMIDALPILAVIGCFAEGPTEICNGSTARLKESDRIAAIVGELKKMGAQIEEKEDGLTVYPSKLRGTHVLSHYDHRIALSLSVAAMGATGCTTLHDAQCVNKTHPTFVADFQAIGAEICYE